MRENKKTCRLPLFKYRTTTHKNSFVTDDTLLACYVGMIQPVYLDHALKNT